ncbi:GatB/YqeY domain-containing protein [Arcobacter sp. FWKO B]|uniref:GatB/YqeY domain-containing protein n=1 Tax=Arcobacter sp. FWKO B TaxID=2593672 RepID=UPI0018A39481|nr:GatB/YqeY domain-containing protein [Arcobacter sp. FWKO B]QOG11696.1 GatB/YqeY domain-containing protein [Arcobacter sp. FWKO B]
MSLQEKLKEDMKIAMRDKNIIARDTIRFLNSAIKQIEVDERRVLDDNDVIKLIQKAIKQRNESIEQFKAASRDDLVENESAQLAVLEQYLPKQLSDDELELKIKDIITKTGATTIKDMGKIMGVASKDLAGIADGKRINETVKKLLG